MLATWVISKIMPRAAYWVFTLNNYTEEEEGLLITAVDEDPEIVFLGYGREIGESGTPHLQGHLELSRRLTLQSLKAKLHIPDRCHLEVRRGTFQQAEDYCNKDGDYYSYGKQRSRGQGCRSDLEALREQCISGASLTQISNDHFGSFLRYRRSIVAFKNLHDPPRNWASSVIVYHGKTGTGKTSAVFGNLGSIEDIWVYPGNGWFDGYQGQPIALFDDFSGSEFKINYLLKLLDRYPMRVPIKGDFVNWKPQEIYITSNLAPIQWYPNAHQEHVDALNRRFTNVVEFQ